jgi:hypothetical protein
MKEYLNDINGSLTVNFQNDQDVFLPIDNQDDSFDRMIFIHDIFSHICNLKDNRKLIRKGDEKKAT